MCQTCYNHLYENAILYQAVCNKMVLDPIPDELKDLKKLGKVLISKIILFKKIIILGKEELFLKNKGSIFNIPNKLQIYTQD